MDQSVTESDAPIRYIERTRAYYRALGYPADYVWATFAEVPFTRLRKPLREARLALITTASPADFDGVKRVWSGSTSTPPDAFFTDNVAWDKESTHTKDRECFMPVTAAKELVSQGLFAGLTARFHGVPTEYSQRLTQTIDGPDVVARVREDKADAAVLCPLCPVCHQTLSMVARQLEESGIPTVVVGSALDVVEHCGVPRLCFTDFPLGNPCGHPYRPDMQLAILRQAVGLLETAEKPRTSVRAPFAWKEESAAWRPRYGRVDPADAEHLLRLGEERRRKAAAAPKRTIPAG